MTDIIKHEKNLPVQAREITPMDMVALALEKGIDIKDLLKMQADHEANKSRMAYMAAMNNFKETVPDIIKNKKVSFGNTRYKHATLYHVCDVISEELSKYGLSHAWSTDQSNGLIKVTCTISHQLGHSETNSIEAEKDDTGSKNKIQQIGSTITYLQRYTLLAAVGMAAKDQDDDGAAIGNDMETRVDDDLLAKSEDAATNGLDHYKKWFTAQSITNRSALTMKDTDGICEHDRRKAEAQHIDEMKV